MASLPMGGPAMLTIRGDIHRFLQFAAVGASNTIVHLLGMLLLVEVLGLVPVAANIPAFLAANVWSFIANSVLTFRAAVVWTKYPRFLSLSLVAMAVSTGIVQAFQSLGWHYVLGVLASTGTSLVINFLLVRWAVFGTHSGSRDSF